MNEGQFDYSQLFSGIIVSRHLCYLLLYYLYANIIHKI